MGKIPRSFEYEDSVLATRNLDEGKRSDKVSWCDHYRREWNIRKKNRKLKRKPPNWKNKSGRSFQDSNYDQGK